MKLLPILIFAISIWNLSHSQSTKQKIYGTDTAIIKVEILDTNFNRIQASVINTNGDTSDLAEFVNAQFQFSQRYIDLGIEGKIYALIALDATSERTDIIRSRGVYDREAEIKQIAAILIGGKKFIIEKEWKFFFIRINLETIYGPRKPVEMIELKAIQPYNKKRRK